MSKEIHIKDDVELGSKSSHHKKKRVVEEIVPAQDSDIDSESDTSDKSNVEEGSEDASETSSEEIDSDADEDDEDDDDNDPLYEVLSQIFVSKDGVNLADLLSDINNNLKEISKRMYILSHRSN